MMKNKVLVMAAMALMIFSAACSPKAFAAGDYKPAESNANTPVVAFNLASDGTFAVATYDGRNLEGTYTVSGDKITLNAAKGGPCFGSPMTMSWTSSGNSLALKTVEDACSEGISYDLAGDWSKQP
jgi:hypothetical protein